MICSWLGRLADALGRLGHDEVDEHRLPRRRLLVLDPGEVEKVVDDPADPERLGVDPVRQTLGHLRLVLDEERLGEEADGPHGRLQLVADVGDEVAADVLEAPALGDVVDDGDDPEGALAVVDALCAHDKRAPWRAVELEHPLLARAWRSRGEELLDRLGGDGVAVAAAHERDGLAVAEHGVAALVGDEHGLGEGVERPAEPDRLGARLGHGLGGAVSGPLDVDEDVLEVLGLLRRRVGAEPGSERLSRWRRLRVPRRAVIRPVATMRRDHDDDGDDELENRQAKDRAHCPKHGMAGRPAGTGEFPSSISGGPVGDGGSRCGQSSNADRATAPRGSSPSTRPRQLLLPKR